MDEEFLAFISCVSEIMGIFSGNFLHPFDRYYYL
jgi:hypothetical protein